MEKYTVLITTSGIGSRLGEFTKYTNKALLRIGKKPAISHIIENYPDHTKFVITLGYYGNQVRDFLELAYPEKQFEFVTIENFSGKGSSLLFSISHVRKKLQEPFIYHASDSIVLDKIPSPSKNWITGFKGIGSSAYASFDVMGAKVTSIYGKGNMDPDFLHIGIVGFYNYQAFWNLVDEVLIDKEYDSALGDVDVIQKMIKTNEFGLVECKQWFDIGNVEKWNEAKPHFNSEEIHVLDKLGESIFYVNGHIIKFFYDEVMCENRVKRATLLPNIVPTIVDSKKNFYKYKFIEGETFSNTANGHSILSLFKWAEKNLWKKNDTIKKNEFKKLCEDFYFTKTEKRLKQFYETRGLKDEETIINDESVPTARELFQKIDRNYLCDSEPTNFHGDFILENIISKGNGEFELIDWRQDFAGNLQAGDMYYDIGKLTHNLVVNHEMIEKNHFTINKKNNKIYLNIHRFQTLVESENILFTYLKRNDYDVKKINILRSIIWLNMSPLHHHPFDLFLYYFGKYSLFKSIQ